MEHARKSVIREIILCVQRIMRHISQYTNVCRATFTLFIIKNIIMVNIRCTGPGQQYGGILKDEDHRSYIYSEEDTQSPL